MERVTLVQMLEKRPELLIVSDSDRELFGLVVEPLSVMLDVSGMGDVEDIMIAFVTMSKIVAMLEASHLKAASPSLKKAYAIIKDRMNEFVTGEVGG